LRVRDFALCVDWVKFVGTHAQHDRIDAESVNDYQEGLTPRDLEPFIGPSGRVSEVLNRKSIARGSRFPATRAGHSMPSTSHRFSSRV